MTSDVVPFDPLFLNLLVRLTTVHFDSLSDSRRYTLILCLIHKGTLWSFVRFTTVHFDPLSASQRYTLFLCPIHNCTLWSFVRLRINDIFLLFVFSLQMWRWSKLIEFNTFQTAQYQYLIHCNSDNVIKVMVVNPTFHTLNGGSDGIMYIVTLNIPFI